MFALGIVYSFPSLMHEEKGKELRKALAEATPEEISKLFEGVLPFKDILGEMNIRCSKRPDLAIGRATEQAIWAVLADRGIVPRN